MYPELKLLGLRPVAKVVGFQKPCPLQSSQGTRVVGRPLGRTKSQDRLAHRKGVRPNQTGSGRAAARTCGLSPLSLSCTTTSLRTLFRARLPEQTRTILGVSTPRRFVPWRVLSRCSTNHCGGQTRAKALQGARFLSRTPRGLKLPVFRAYA